MQRQTGGRSRGRSAERIDVTDVPAEQVQAYARGDRGEHPDLFLERRGARTFLVDGSER
ncbi:hypothetical protein ACFQE1_09315 [Halobium palmae]|uniref:Uncharacterized protein n=1 Tax=Halobium palmae TaxID=1776492 RepID=A0ABD5RYV1_9EURY